EGKSIQVSLVALHPALVVRAISLHPGGRSPHAAPELDVAFDCDCRMDKGNQAATWILVMIDGEVGHGRVTARLVEGVPLNSVVARANWNAPPGKTQAVFRVKE